MLKKLFFSVIFLISTAYVSAQVVINSAEGWLESANVTWKPVTGATSYNVYYTGGGKTDQIIDTQLIRSYGTYFRADVLGLAAGSYTLKVDAIATGGAIVATNTTTSLNVIAHDRNGFAFQGQNPSAYNMDGTAKTGAVILYITQNTKNSVSLNVTGATKNPCVGLQTIMDGFAKGKDTRPLIVRLIGNITDLSYLTNGDLYISNAQNPACSMTFEGVGIDAVTNGWSVCLKSATNIEVRNVASMNNNSTNGDDFGLQQDNDHVWIHNNDMFYGDAGSDADQVKGDGAMDIKLSTFVTVSYNHFHDNGKSSLLGLKENTTSGLYVTYHHNWFDHSDSRHPRVRFYSAHVYNNYYDGVSKYGAGSTLGSSLFVENNYYRDSKYPMLTSLQGSDVWNGTTMKNDPGNLGTFSGEAGGTIKAFNNTFDQDGGTNDMRFVAYGDTNPAFNVVGVTNSTIDFDAYLATTRGELVPNTVKSFSGANMYNNFDTDPTLYVKTLVPDSPIDAKAKVIQYAGRIDGGDLKWVFDNTVDDAGHLVISGLKTLVTNYTSTMINVQGETAAIGNQTLIATTNNNNQTVSAGVAISKIVFTWGGDATSANVTGLPNGIVAATDPTAKTITLTGIPTETLGYTITTVGSIGVATSDSGTIIVLPASSQTLVLTSGNTNQSVLKDTAITPIVLTWGGDATDVDVTGLPDGVSTLKDSTAKTVTISGTATSIGALTFTALTSGSIGTSVAISGTIIVTSAGDQIHNFSAVTPPTYSTFYAITGNMNNSNPAAITYLGILLTKALKIETATTITFVTTAAATLTLVFDPTLDAAKRIYVTPTGTSPTSSNSYTAASGVVTVSLPVAGSYTITKRDSANLYYMKTSYTTNLGLNNNTQTSNFNLYPNPVTDKLFLPSTDQKIENIMIYSITGNLVKNISKDVDSIDVSNLTTGNYLVKVTTDQGSFTQKIIKK